MMEEYLRLTIEEANSFASHNYERDIALYDQLMMFGDRMGYLFAEAVYSYITSGGRVVDLPADQCLTYDQMNAVFGIEMLWFEIITWARAYMLSKIENIGNVEEVYARFRQVAGEFGNVMRALFGEEVSVAAERLVNTFIEELDALITAQMEGNRDETNASTRGLYQTAHEFAELISTANPAWDESVWESILFDLVRNLIDESTTLLAGNYAMHLDIFARLLDQAEAASGYFARGLLQYERERGFPD